MPPPRRRPGPRRGKNASTKHSPRTPASTQRFRMLDTHRLLEFRRSMRDAIGITVDDTSGKSSIVANVAVKAMQQGVEDTVTWVRGLQQAGTLTVEQAERIVGLLNHYSRWR